MAQSEHPVLETRGLHVHYGPVHALRGVDLALPGPSLTACIGPSGCGKTTLLRAFNRMNDAVPGVRTEGEVLVEGRDVNRPGVHLESLRKKVGLVFQRSNLFPMSIRDNITFGPRMAGVRDAERLAGAVERALRLADLWGEVRDRLESSAYELSVGQQQRLCIARALANEPDILLLDEPASALDPISTGKIEDTLVQLKDRFTIFMVTHNLQQAARIADHTAFLVGGQLMEYGPSETMFTTPVHQITEDYITGRFG
jgi:phosphate transport system ATP-binding protein